MHSCSSSAWEVFFHRNIILGKQNTFIMFIIIIAPRPKLTPSRRRPEPSKRLCFGLSAKNPPTYYLAGGLLAGAGSQNYCPPGRVLAVVCSQNGPETNESGCLGPGLGPGPPWGPKGRPWGPMPTHTPRCPGFGPDEFRWPLRTTICMAKEMRFLRLLLEWPGFPTLSYGVIQCTAAVPLHGMCFSPE